MKSTRMKKRIKGKLMLHHLLFHHFLKTTEFLKQEKSRLKDIRISILLSE